MKHRSDCPNVLPGAECVDPNCLYCAYCAIADAEEPKPAPVSPAVVANELVRMAADGDLAAAGVILKAKTVH